MKQGLDVPLVAEELAGTKPAKNHRKELKYTDEDVDKLICRKFAQWQKKQQKAVDEAIRLSAMKAQQHAEEKCYRLQQELDVLKRPDTFTDRDKVVRIVLRGNGIPVSEELLSLLVAAANERLRGELPRKRRRRTAGRPLVQPAFSLQEKVIQSKNL